MNKAFATNSERPNLDHLMSLFENDVLAAFVTGHLIIESLLVQLLVLKGENKVKMESKNFPYKIDKCKDYSLLSDKMKDYLLSVNRIRNNFAHNLGYRLSFDEIFVLVAKAGEAGIDFSDETIYENKELSLEWYGFRGVIQELFQNTAMDLSFLMEENGGEFQFA